MSFLLLLRICLLWPWVAAVVIVGWLTYLAIGLYITRSKEP